MIQVVRIRFQTYLSFAFKESFVVLFDWLRKSVALLWPITLTENGKARLLTLPLRAGSIKVLPTF